MTQLSRFAFSIGAATALLTGCGGSRSSFEPPGTAPANAIRSHAGRGRASIAVGAFARSLLYVNLNSVEVYWYPRLKALGSLGVAGYLCSDRFGHVFVATQPGMGEVWVYNHGTSQPFAILHDPSVVGGCSVDPSTENVADAGYIPGSVTIWPYSRRRGWGLAQDYTIPNMGVSRYCAYDPQGNLFIDGLKNSGPFGLEELPKGSSTFITITLDQKIGDPGSLQWTGKYLVVEDATNLYEGPAVIYRFVISGRSGHKVSSTTLTDSIANAQFLVHGSTVIGPARQNSTPGLGFWNFPSGGAPIRFIPTYPNPSGEALSLK
ncbi:MAG TPA: hypothetical protein VIW73_09615 [Candidatus Cybelea sp.]